ncbi:hypothetical protein PBI_SCTP2_73 [Salicola phage SCTP-2]|nr:hypothetical protein PBI_SCTP2_73 [Salicola phage SCTP-2]
MLRYEDLEYILRPYIEIGMYYPKSGNTDDITVVNFYISERNALEDIITFINYMPLKTLIDVSHSNYINNNFEYVIFVELTNSSNTFDDILRLCYELMSTSNLEEWDLKVYGKHSKTYNKEQLENYFISNSKKQKKRNKKETKEDLK